MGSSGDHPVIRGFGSDLPAGRGVLQRLPHIPPQYRIAMGANTEMAFRLGAKPAQNERAGLLRGGTLVVTYTVAIVPEPATWLLGMVLIGAARLRR